MVKKKPNKAQFRSLVTRNKLIEVAIEAFANKGYEGVGIRELSLDAGVNLSAIRYHFGDKRGLYRAAIQHISQGMHERVAPFIEQVRVRIGEPGISRDELTTCLCHLVTSFSSQLLASGVSDNWARLVTREQINPTEAFPTMYRIFRLLTDTVAEVIAKISGTDSGSEEVRISAMALIGQVTIFRTHRATAMNFIGWKTLGSREISTLQSVLANHCRAIVGVSARP